MVRAIAPTRLRDATAEQRRDLVQQAERPVATPSSRSQRDKVRSALVSSHGHLLKIMRISDCSCSCFVRLCRVSVVRFQLSRVMAYHRIAVALVIAAGDAAVLLPQLAASCP